MGKALVFEGVNVSNPLRIVTFIKERVTADDYINDYVALATKVTPEQKNVLRTFVQDMMNKGIWDKIQNFYPMLGGMEGYKYDLKDIDNQVEWSVPSFVTWDVAKNCLDFALNTGKEDSIAIVKTFNSNNGTVFTSHYQLASQANNILSSKNAFGSESAFGLFVRFQHYGDPHEVKFKGRTDINTESNTIGVGEMPVNMAVVLEPNKWSVIAKGKSDNYYIKENTDVPTDSLSEISEHIGGYYAANVNVGSNTVFHSNFFAFGFASVALSEGETKNLLEAIDTLNKELGRY